MSDEEDFDLDELINSHSVKGNSQDDKEISEYENELQDEEKHSNDEDIVDYDISEEIKFGEDINIDDLLSGNDEEYKDYDSEINITPEDTPQTKRSGTLFGFAQNILSEMEKRNLPPTPENYKIYFYELLQTESDHFQENIYSILDKEKSGKDEERKREIEETLQHSLKLTHQLLNLTSKVHGNITIMRNIAHKRDEELTTKSSRDIVRLLKFDLGKLENILGKQSESMKNIYGRTVSAVNNIYEKTIFDKEYGVYNRRHFLESLNDEIQKMEYFKHSSSIVFVIPHRRLTSKHLTPKIAFIVAKTISKILMESFRRNDIVAYYGNSIFAVLVNHSTIKETEEKVERFAKKLKDGSLFISGREVEIRVKIGISELLQTRKVEQSLFKALDALKKANRLESSLYEVIN